MAIVKLQKLSICAGKKNRKAILETLQSLGAVEIFTDEIDAAEDGLEKMDTQTARSQFEKSADTFDRAQKLLAAYAPDRGGGLGLFSGKKVVGRGDYEEVVVRKYALLEEANQVLRTEKDITEAKGTIIKDENQIASLEPWMSLDVPMNCTGTDRTELFIGTLPEPVAPEALYAAAAKDLPEPVSLTADVLSTSNEQTCISVLCLKRDRSKVEENLRSIGFARPAQTITGTPREMQESLRAEIAEQNAKIEKLEEKLRTWPDRGDEFKIVSDYYRTRAEKYRLLGTIPQSEHVFFLEGWAPADKADRIAELLRTRYGALVEKEEVREDEDEPTLLSNNKFSESVEGILESYSLPTKGHVDPSFIMSFFYVFFFGMMFSDGGYGIIMLAACGFVLLRYGKKLESGLRKMVKLFFWCGVSTAFWGFMYGSFFGDAVDVVAKTFFGYTGETPILKPLWFEPMGEPMRLLVWCMFFGLIHLFFGLGIKGYEYIKDKDYVGFVSDVLSWFLFLVGLILLLLPSDLFGSIAGDAFDFSGLASLGTVAKILTFAGLILILVMQERSQKNWVLRILLGAYDVYGVSGWLSDVLSYSRLLALGLATGVIAQVINMMGSMGGRSVIGVIMFVIVFIVGHALNFAINVLGAYVHTNRLQYVEFFGKFYEGGGRPFKAFRTANQYIEIKEES